MNRYTEKKEANKGVTASSAYPAQLAEKANALQLRDNRAQSVVQKKQVEAMAGGKPVQRKANNTGLPDQLKSGVESLSGHSMDDVKVYYNSDKPAQLNAHAYAQGTDIHIASGQEKHLPHEVWHVVQQKQGRVRPTMQMKGKVNVNDDSRLEKEADVMGGKALQALGSIDPSERSALSKTGKTIQQKTTTGDVLQRFYVDSYLLKFEPPEKPELKQQANVEEAPEADANDIYYSKTGFAGPWKKNTDTTSKGYRESANKALGGNEALTVLSKYDILTAPNPKRFPYTLSHLISAEFTGQIKYPVAADNIRFFPEALEYGAWQIAETKVKKVGKLGFLQVLGSDGNILTVFRMAEEIIDKVRDLFSPMEAVEMEIQLYKILHGAQYVPKSVRFRYTDYEGGENVVLNEANLNSGLGIKAGVTPQQVLKALKTFGILPERGIGDEAIAVETHHADMIATDADIIRIIDSLGVAGPRRNIMVDGLNRLISSWRGSISEQKPNGVFDIRERLAAQINKFPEMQKAARIVNVTLANPGLIK